MTQPALGTACLDREQLARFRLGNFPISLLDEFAEHLDRCSDCQARLLDLPESNDGLLSALRKIDDVPSDDPSWQADLAALETDSVAILRDTNHDRWATVDNFKLPEVLREYRILGPIGRGGMGAVYRAVHSRLDKVVAIKVMSPDRLGDAGAVARFQREMRAVGKLNHANIVSATDAGEVDGAPFLVMEFVEGIDFARLIKRQGPLPVAEACELVRQAAVGLQYAHSHGLVHRDIKPSNLLLTSAPDQPTQGLVKVADLGLALLSEAESDASGSATSTNRMIGSLDYMAPEQADDAHQVDHRADLYSLGCTMYELLTGKPPFAVDGRQTRLQKLKAHADAPVPSLAGVGTKPPAGLEPLLRRLLAKESSERPVSAAELAAALEPFCAGANLGRLLDETSPGVVPLPHLKSAAPPDGKRWKGLLLGCAGLFLAASVVYVQTNRGTLEIKSDDNEVKVRVEQEGKLITVVDLKANKEIRLRSGTYEVALGDTEQDLALDADEFTLRRGGKEVLHIRRQSPTLIRPPFDAAEAKRHQERWAHFRGVPSQIKSDSGMELTLIPPGDFEMRPGYRVKITRPYYLGTREITVAQFRQFAEATGYKSPLEEQGRGTVDLASFQETPGMNWRNPQLARGDDHPVAGVTWFDADRFCTWLSERDKKKYRLPTEAEWEWAERGGTLSPYAWGDDGGKTGDYEWYNGNSEGHTHPVGQKPANAFGLYDINGNIVEWCGDWYLNPLPQAEVSDPTGPSLPAGPRVLRGGSYMDDPSPFTSRGSFGPASSMIHCGFRVCREL